MGLKKRGLSSVVATALLILITIAAVVMVAGFIIPFVNKSLDSTSCFNFRDYFSFEMADGFNCKSSGNIYSISVKIKADSKDAEKVKGFIIRFRNNETSKSINVTDGADSTSVLTMFEGGDILVIPKAGEYSLLSYNYTSETNYTVAEIYSFLEDRVCDRSDSIKLKEC